MARTHYQVLIIGGGNAGISVAAHLLRRKPNLVLGIIEPNDKHYYQPAWTLVGGGAYDIQKTVQPEAKYIPKGADWIKEYAEEILPDTNTIVTRSEKQIYVRLPCCVHWHST